MCVCRLQVSEQMKAQTSPSSSIIIVLTDGKLEVYPFELSVQEVPASRTRTEHTLTGFIHWFQGILVLLKLGHMFVNESHPPEVMQLVH